MNPTFHFVSLTAAAAATTSGLLRTAHSLRFPLETNPLPVSQAQYFSFPASTGHMLINEQRVNTASRTFRANKIQPRTSSPHSGAGMVIRITSAVLVLRIEMVGGSVVGIQTSPSTPNINARSWVATLLTAPGAKGSRSVIHAEMVSTQRLCSVVQNRHPSSSSSSWKRALFIFFRANNHMRRGFRLYMQKGMEDRAGSLFWHEPPLQPLPPPTQPWPQAQAHYTQFLTAVVPKPNMCFPPPDLIDPSCTDPMVGYMVAGAEKMKRK